MADFFGGGDKARGYQMPMAVMAIIALFMFLFCFAYVKERIEPAIPSKHALKSDLRDIWKNDQWVRLSLLTFFNVSPGFIRMAATLYYVTWVMEKSTSLASFFISLDVTGMMLGSALAKPLTDKFCKIKLFWTNIILSIFSLGFYFVDPEATSLFLCAYFILNVYINYLHPFIGHCWLMPMITVNGRRANA